MGTLKNIPDTPQIFPIKERKTINIKGLKFKVLPINLGSRKFPNINCINRRKIRVINEFKGSINWKNEKIVGNRIDSNEPM